MSIFDAHLIGPEEKACQNCTYCKEGTQRVGKRHPVFFPAWTCQKNGRLVDPRHKCNDFQHKTTTDK